MSESGLGSYFVGGALALKFLAIVAILVYHIGLYKLFEKADKSGWKALIPFYNIAIIIEIVHRPKWWIIIISLLFILPVIAYYTQVPMLNILLIFPIIPMLVTLVELSKSFDKPVLFTVGMVILPIIFIMIIGFDESQYLTYKEKDFITS